jgi:hypothetical protein
MVDRSAYERERDRYLQRLSFVYGTLALTDRPQTREHIRRIALNLWLDEITDDVPLAIARLDRILSALGC